MAAQKSGVKTAEAITIGAGVVALAAASYYLFGPGGKAHRKVAQGWMIKMKGEVIERIENLKEVSEPIYNQIIDTVAAKYAKSAKISEQEIALLSTELKRSWKTIAAAHKKASGSKKSSPKKR